MNAWLYEPDAAAFAKLQQLYARADGTQSTAGASDSASQSRVHIRNRVRLFNFALSDQRGMATLRSFPAGFENTIVADKRGQYGNDLGKWLSVRRHSLCAYKPNSVGDCGGGTDDDD